MHPLVKKLWLALIVTGLIAPAIAHAAPSPAVHAACVADARRLCGSVFDDAKARMACMRAHRAEWSDRCKAAVAVQKLPVRQKRGPLPDADQSSGCATSFHGRCRTAAWTRRRELCARFVADFYRDHSGEHRNAAPKAVRRCMVGGPMYEKKLGR